VAHFGTKPIFWPQICGQRYGQMEHVPAEQMMSMRHGAKMAKG